MARENQPKSAAEAGAVPDTSWQRAGRHTPTVVRDGVATAAGRPASSSCGSTSRRWRCATRLSRRTMLTGVVGTNAARRWATSGPGDGQPRAVRGRGSELPAGARLPRTCSSRGRGERSSSSSEDSALSFASLKRPSTSKASLVRPAAVGRERRRGHGSPAAGRSTARC